MGVAELQLCAKETHTHNIKPFENTWEPEEHWLLPFINKAHFQSMKAPVANSRNLNTRLTISKPEGLIVVIKQAEKTAKTEKTVWGILSIYLTDIIYIIIMVVGEKNAPTLILKFSLLLLPIFC